MLAEMIKQKVISSGRDISEIAFKSRVSRQTIHNLMNGGDVLLSTAERLANSLGLEVELKAERQVENDLQRQTI